MHPIVVAFSSEGDSSFTFDDLPECVVFRRGKPGLGGVGVESVVVGIQIDSYTKSMHGEGFSSDDGAIGVATSVEIQPQS